MPNETVTQEVQEEARVVSDQARGKVSEPQELSDKDIAAEADITGMDNGSMVAVVAVLEVPAPMEL